MDTTMSNSDELRDKAILAFQDAAGCDKATAARAVHGIASYIARWNDEIVNHYGPAHYRIYFDEGITAPGPQDFSG